MRLFKVFCARKGIDRRIDLVHPGEGMEDDHAGFGAFQKFGRDPVGGRVVCKSDRIGETFPLKPGHIQDIQLWNGLFDMVVGDQFNADITEILFDVFGKIESVGSDRMETDIIVFCKGKREVVDSPSVPKISLESDVDVFDSHRLVNGKEIE